jgi:hypothetical protein
LLALSFSGFDPSETSVIDGPQHEGPDQVERDRTVREALRDQGFRVIAIKSGSKIADQVSANIDAFRRR